MVSTAARTKQILIAGFGGQGILFAGRFLAYEGMIEGKEVSWLPSYGPEMRGGTANCAIIISSGPIGSPIVTSPDILIAMNLPSLDKFERDVVPGGQIFVDSSLIDQKVKRDDTENFYIPATQMASDEGLSGLANMIILGQFVRHSNVIPYENIPKAMEKIISPTRKNMFDLNIKAIDLGYNY